MSEPGTNDTGTIDLTDEERALLTQIDFGWKNHDGLQRSAATAGLLTRMLIKRGAIPERRTRYFVEPEWGTRGKSWQQIFESNGTSGAEIFSHGHFLKYLRFFIHGANLPSRVKDAMREQIGRPDWFTSGDHEPARKLARQLCRANGLDSTHAEDFVHFCCDLGLSANSADSIGRAVKTVKGR